MPKILVIDDDAFLRLTVSEVLKEHGFEVIEAENGQEGVQMAQDRLPDLILSDYAMAEMNGHLALNTLREIPATAAIPFILMTGSPDLASMRSTMNLGADDYLTKPFTMDTLVAAVQSQLKKQQLRAREADRKLEGLRENLSLMLPHELNTPLVGILGIGDLLATSTGDLSPSEIREMGENLILSGRRLQRITQNFLLYSQIILWGTDPERAKKHADGLTTDPDRAASHIARKVAETHQRQADLNVHLDEHAPIGMGDELFSKIVEELLDNAFKFSPAGTAVSLQFQMDSPHLKVLITDLGRGFTSEEITHIGAFVQFQRKLHEQQGSGLGLAIVRGLVDLHQGRLEVLSEAEKGTTVIARIPLAG
jgi:two-component system, sensor histidine kinase and response regulator